MMRLLSIFFTTVMLPLLASTACVAAPAPQPDVKDVQPKIKSIEPPARILFVGNSFTYYNNSLHNHLGNLMRSAGKYKAGKTRLRAMTISGSALSEHLEGIGSILKPDEFDVVLMQGYSTGPIKPSTEEGFKQAAREASNIIRSQGAQPVLWMTWAYENAPEMTAQLRDSYTATANELDLLVIPVGLAFARVVKETPDIELYSKDIAGFDSVQGETRVRYKTDIKHPSMAGSYLAACVFYAALLGESPEGLAYNAGIDAANAAKLQRAAWLTVQDFYQ